MERLAQSCERRGEPRLHGADRNRSARRDLGARHPFEVRQCEHALVAGIELPHRDAHARVVWARDLGAAENEKLRRYYPDRNVWLLEPDARPPKLTRY